MEMEYIFQDGHVFVYSGHVCPSTGKLEGRWFSKVSERPSRALAVMDSGNSQPQAPSPSDEQTLVVRSSIRGGEATPSTLTGVLVGSPLFTNT